LSQSKRKKSESAISELPGRWGARSDSSLVICLELNLKLCNSAFPIGSTVHDTTFAPHHPWRMTVCWLKISWLKFVSLNGWFSGRQLVKDIPLMLHNTLNMAFSQGIVSLGRIGTISSSSRHIYVGSVFRKIQLSAQWYGDGN
jgi:hypothetical protein